MTATVSGRGYKDRERQSNTNALGGTPSVTPPSVTPRPTGSRQGNGGPPLAPLPIGCLCWLRHTGLAGPGGPAPGDGPRRASCRSAAERRPLALSPPPPRAWGDCWAEGAMTSGGGGKRGRSEGAMPPFALRPATKRRSEFERWPYLCSVGSSFFASP